MPGMLCHPVLCCAVLCCAVLVVYGTTEWPRECECCQAEQ